MINRSFVVAFIIYVSALIIIWTHWNTSVWVILLIICSFIIGTINALIVIGFWRNKNAGDKRQRELNLIFRCLFGFIGLYTGGQALMMFINRKQYYNLEKLKYQDIGYLILTAIFVWLLSWIYKKRK